MFRLCFIAFSILLVPAFAFSQHQVPVHIIVSDSAGVLLPGVAARLEKAGKTVVQESTRSDGTVTFEVAPGMYTVHLSYLGYEPLYTSIVVNHDTHTFPFSLKEKPLQLGEVSVIALKPFIHSKPGRLIIKVKDSPLSASISAWEMLKGTPTVRIGSSEELVVLNQATVVYVNDRLVQLSADDLKVYLENIAGESVERIEVVHSPGAAGMASAPTALRIYTSSNENEGFRGSTRAGISQNTFPHYLYGGHIDWRKGKFAIQSSFNASQNRARVSGTLQTDLEGAGSSLQNRSDNTTDGISWNNELSYQASQNTQLFANLRLLSNKSTRKTRSYSPSQESLLNTGNLKNSSYNSSVGFGLRHRVDSTQQLMIQAEHVYNNAALQNNYTTFSSAQAAGNTSVLEQIDRSSPVYLLHANYKKETEKQTIDAGFRYSRVALTNNNQAFNLSASTESKLNYRFDEHIFAAYGNYETTIGQWSYSTGLRVERTNVNTGFTDGELPAAEPPRRYLSIFPSALAQYATESGQAFSLSYKKNITRPDYYLLNPFRRYTGNISSFEGSVDMRPQFTHTLDATAILSPELMVSGGAQLIKDFISTYLIASTNGEGILERYQNFDGTRIYYVYVGYTKAWNPKWSTITNGSAYYAKARLADVQTKNPTPAATLTMTNQLKFGKTWINVLRYTLNTGYSDGFFQHRRNASLDYTLQKSFLKPNIVGQLTITDITRSDWQGNRALYNNFVYNTEAYADANKVRFTLIYKFGKSKLKMPKVDVKDETDVKTRLEKS